MIWAKAWVLWFLAWRAQREAGFTEQRKPPALNSGRITGWCASEPALPSESGSIEPSLFIFLIF